MSVSGPRISALQSSSGTVHPSAEDLTLFAMELLSEADSRTISTHLRECDSCRQELGRIYGDLTVPAATVDLASPSTAARTRLLQQVAREKKIIASTPAQISQTGPLLTPESGSQSSGEEEHPSAVVVRHYRGPMIWMGWPVAAVLAVGVAFFAGDRKAMRDAINSQNAEIRRLNTNAASAHMLLDALTDPQADRVTLASKPQPKSGPSGGITYDADRGTLVFLGTELDPLEPAKTYELWLIPQDGAAPIPAGDFRPDDRGNASVVLPDLPKGISAKAFWVTIENEGGSDKPSPPIIMAGS